VQRLLIRLVKSFEKGRHDDIGARVAIVDPLGVWWGLRASANGSAAGYPVVVFGGRHADVPISAEMGAPLGRMIAGEALACVVDLSELGSNAARRRFEQPLDKTVGRIGLARAGRADDCDPVIESLRGKSRIAIVQSLLCRLIDIRRLFTFHS
jgi:hypothetical protein